jgi:hypothetical protein
MRIIILFYIFHFIYGSAIPIKLGRESDMLVLYNSISPSSEWVQIISPAGGVLWYPSKLFDPMLPLNIIETRFQIFYPLDGSYIVPDTITYVTWKTFPGIGSSFPSDVKITLYNMYDDEISVLAHSVPNNEVWLWIARVPRSYSNDDFYKLQICSLINTNECSFSNSFRITNPYAFYP